MLTIVTLLLIRTHILCRRLEALEDAPYSVCSGPIVRFPNEYNPLQLQSIASRSITDCLGRRIVRVSPSCTIFGRWNSSSERLNHVATIHDFGRLSLDYPFRDLG